MTFELISNHYGKPGTRTAQKQSKKEVRVLEKKKILGLLQLP